MRRYVVLSYTRSAIYSTIVYASGVCRCSHDRKNNHRNATCARSPGATDHAVDGHSIDHETHSLHDSAPHMPQCAAVAARGARLIGTSAHGTEVGFSGDGNVKTGSAIRSVAMLLHVSAI